MRTQCPHVQIIPSREDPVHGWAAQRVYRNSQFKFELNYKL
jgi:hypothetical protein